MDNDDLPVGRILTRREAFTLLSAAGSMMLSPFGRAEAAAPWRHQTSPACLVRPEVIEGPYFVDRTLNRSDIRRSRARWTRGKAFLRGYQMTDGNGLARFTTIYPGWYPGRAVHIHFKIRKDAAPGQAWEFTGRVTRPPA